MLNYGRTNSQITCGNTPSGQNQQQLMAFLKDHMQSIMPDSSTQRSTSASSLKNKECEKIASKRKELEQKLPEHLTTTETMDVLEIPKATFYRNVYKILLFPEYPYGKQPYYPRTNVIEFALHIVHEPGAHTFSKLKKKLFE